MKTRPGCGGHSARRRSSDWDAAANPFRYLMPRASTSACLVGGLFRRLQLAETNQLKQIRRGLEGDWFVKPRQAFALSVFNRVLQHADRCWSGQLELLRR